MPATLASTCSVDRRVPLLRLAAGIADEAGAAADERDRRVTEPLQPREAHHRQQDADVQARRGRVEADVCGDALACRAPRAPIGRVGHHAAPLELFEQSSWNLNTIETSRILPWP